jgi:16S rRNA processing protein RimM
MSAPRVVCVGEIRGAFGVRGEARIASFTSDPEALFAYGPLLDETGAPRLTVTSWRPIKDGFAARAKEIATREDAEAMRGRKLYAGRAALPDPGEDEFYLTDLAGLAVRHVDGRAFGRVRAAVNFGGGDLLEIVGTPGVKGEWYLPFTRDFVPDVDLAAQSVTIDPPEGLIPES